VIPQAGVSGGHVALACADLDPQALATCRIVFGTSPTRPVLTTPALLVDADAFPLVRLCCPGHLNPTGWQNPTILANF